MLTAFFTIKNKKLDFNQTIVFKKALLGLGGSKGVVGGELFQNTSPIPL
ncbi:hypothetical protein BD0078_04580 [Helicobacter pylori]